ISAICLAMPVMDKRHPLVPSLTQAGFDNRRTDTILVDDEDTERAGDHVANLTTSADCATHQDGPPLSCIWSLRKLLPVSDSNKEVVIGCSTRHVAFRSASSAANHAMEDVVQ